MAVIRKIKLQKACYQAVTKATTKNSHSNDRFGFKGCEKLVGENVTKYNPKMVGVEYARIDGGKDNPGYLTAKE